MSVLDVSGAAQGTMAAAPVRGTQSFVGVMAEVFWRPSLTGLEALWRWVFWCAVLARPAHWMTATGGEVIAAFQAGGFVALGRELAVIASALRLFVESHVGVLLGVLGLWLLVSAAGRMFVLR